MAQGVVENMIILLWSCTVGLVLVLPVLLFMRRAWFPEDEKQLEQAKNPVGAALMGLLRESSSTRHVPLRSNPSENSQLDADHSHHNIYMNWQCGEPQSTLMEDVGAFGQLLQSRMVLLEKCQLESENGSHALTGDIAVINKDQITNIFVRHSSDGWESFTDTTAQYVSSRFTSDGAPFDLFQFKLPFDIGEDNAEWSCNMEFAISYQVHNTETWDNNNGENYQLHMKQLDNES